eukprot:scaffold84515_cov54-Phaeocystis_antarctica.AAC.2
MAPTAEGRGGVGHRRRATTTVALVTLLSAAALLTTSWTASSLLPAQSYRCLMHHRCQRSRTAPADLRSVPCAQGPFRSRRCSGRGGGADRAGRRVLPAQAAGQGLPRGTVGAARRCG